MIEELLDKWDEYQAEIIDMKLSPSEMVTALQLYKFMNWLRDNYKEPIL